MIYPLIPTILGDRSDWANRKEHKTRAELHGSFITAFRMDGCMASVATFLWTGVVYAFEPSPHLEKNTYQALVKVLKHTDRNGDIRDGFCGHERVWVSDSSLQMIYPKMYFYYR